MVLCTFLCVELEDVSEQELREQRTHEDKVYVLRKLKIIQESIQHIHLCVQDYAKHKPGNIST